jgi:hypothetical protein
MAYVENGAVSPGLVKRSRRHTALSAGEGAHGPRLRSTSLMFLVHPTLSEDDMTWMSKPACDVVMEGPQERTGSSGASLK